MPKNVNKTKKPGQILIWQQIPKFKKINFNIKVFSRTLKLKFLSFMTKVNLNNGNETKSDILPWEIFKSDIISFFIKIYSSISMTFIVGTFQSQSEYMQVK